MSNYDDPESDYIEEMGEEELRMLFDSYDPAKRGFISVDDTVNILKSLEVEENDEFIRERIVEMNAENGDKVYFEDFMRFMFDRLGEEEEFEEEDDFDKVVEAFRVFDRDSLGYLSREEFLTILTKLGDPLSQQEVDKLHKEVDLYENGNIHYVKLIDRLRNRR